MNKLFLVISTVFALNSLGAIKLEVFDNPECTYPFFSIVLTGNKALDDRVCRFALGNKEKLMGPEVASIRVGGGLCQASVFQLDQLCERIEKGMKEGKRLSKLPK